MHQKRTNKLFLLTTWRMALTTKGAIFWFLSERHLCRKEGHLYFLPCQMHQKRTNKWFLLTTWRMALLSPQKEQFCCSFLNVIFLEKKTICPFCLAKCIRKGQQIVPFDYMKNGSLHKKSIFLFLSERHLSRKEGHLYFLHCQMHQKRTNKNCSFWLHEEWLSPQKEHFFCSFLNLIFLEKKVICTFCLAKCIRKGRTKRTLFVKIVPFDYMKNGSHHKKSNLCLFLSERHLYRKEGHLYFVPCQMHQKRKKKQECFFWFHDV